MRHLATILLLAASCFAQVNAHSFTFYPGRNKPFVVKMPSQSSSTTCKITSDSPVTAAFVSKDAIPFIKTTDDVLRARCLARNSKQIVLACGEPSDYLIIIDADGHHRFANNVNFLIQRN